MLEGKRASYLMLFLYFVKDSSWFPGDEKMPLPLSTREHLEHWKDPGLLFYFNSKHHRTLLVQRKDIVLLSEFLLKKLENVVDLWNLDDAAVPLPVGVNFQVCSVNIRGKKNVPHGG